MAIETNQDCTTCGVMSRKVADKLRLKEPILRNIQDLRNLPLIPLNCSFGVVKEHVNDKVSLRKMLRIEGKKTDSDITILFAVRRPGCPACREQALQLSEFAAKDGRIALVGTVKENGADDQDILDFYDNFFHHSIYKDANWGIYKAMGSRKISGLGLFKGLMNSFNRYKRKKIDYTLGRSDGWMQGGLLVFDKNGHLRYAYEENFGEELDLELLAVAVAEARSDASSTLSISKDSDESSSELKESPSQ